MCGHHWPESADFLSDPHVRLNGYQPAFEALETGLFIFSHETPDCGTSLALPTGAFRFLHTGPVFRQSCLGKENCPGYCLQGHNLSPCPEACECAWVREVLHKINNHPKRTAA